MTSAKLATDLLASSPFDQLETVTLDQLNARAALQTRVDRKYLIAAPSVELFNVLDARASVLEIDCRRNSSYQSTYLDTPTFDSYLGAARSRPNRFKVRVRTYLDSDLHYLEVKTRRRTGRTHKTRCSAGIEDHVDLSDSGRRFVAETLDDQLPSRPGIDQAATVSALQPALTTHYERTSLLIEPEAGERGTTQLPSRATIDTSLAFTAPGHARLSHPGVAIIETKTAGPPSLIDRLLWQSGHRPVKVSKFGIGRALFNPRLPATKWNRVLRREFGWKPPHTV